MGLTLIFGMIYNVVFMDVQMRSSVPWAAAGVRRWASPAAIHRRPSRAGAALVDSTGEEVELARWQETPIPADGAGAVVVGIEGERAQLGCPCTLKPWEAQGRAPSPMGRSSFR